MTQVRRFSAPLLLAALAFGCAAEHAVEPEAARPVQVVAATAAGSPAGWLPGVLEPADVARLSFRVAGTLATQRATLGRRFEPGETIATLDQEDFALALARGKAERARAAAAAARAAAAHRRARRLYEDGNASASDLEQARAADQAASAALVAADKAVALAARRLEDTVIRAPFAGHAIEVPVDVHETVAAGVPVVVLAREGAFEVALDVPETLVDAIGVGSRATVDVPVAGVFGLPGEVSELGPAGGVGFNAAWPARVRLERTDPRLRAGMSARVRFGPGASPGPAAVFVPLRAVLEDSAGRHVWVFEPDDASAEFGRVTRRPVRTGPLAAGGLLIVEGLELGEYVVAEGASRLVEGQPVRQVFTDGTP